MEPWNIELTECRMNWADIPRHVPYIDTTVDCRINCDNGDRQFEAAISLHVTIVLNWLNEDTAHYVGISVCPLSNIFLLLSESVSEHGTDVPHDNDATNFLNAIRKAIRDHFAEFVHGNIRLLHGAFKVVDPPQEWFPPFELLHDN